MYEEGRFEIELDRVQRNKLASAPYEILRPSWVTASIHV